MKRPTPRDADSLTAARAQRRVADLADPVAAAGAARFFKTGPGAYGEGDVFVGLNAAKLRGLAREFRDLSLTESLVLLRSKIHDERALALLIMVGRSEKGDAATKREVYDAYLANAAHVNNWDLVDVSAGPIVGGHLFERSRRPLYRLAKSKSLWERRISIVATQYFIRRDDIADTLTIAEMLLGDKHDLIHKATGWMLREVGKRDQRALEAFLRRRLDALPRTVLRYAIERFPAEKRQAYLKGTIRR